MKVFHLINTLSAGGAELHLLTLCRYLKRTGVDVVVSYLKEEKSSRPLYQDFEMNDVRVVPLGGGCIRDVFCSWRARALLLKERPNIFHTHLPKADLMGWFLRVMGLRVPWVVSVHAIYSRSWRGRWALPFFSYIWRQADAIIAISYAVRDWLIKEQGIPPSKVQVVYYGIEAHWFSSPESLRVEDDAGPIIGTIGRLDPGKGHETLIRAMPFVLQRFPRARLLIAGHDPWGYSVSLRRLIRNLGLEGKVELLGFVDNIPKFLDKISIFAFASRSEGFGQVVVEAMAAGKPVVASRIAPLTEIVINGETGFLVDPYDPFAFAQAILKILHSPQQARKFGLRGRERVKAVFSAEQMAKKALEIYRSLLFKVT